MAVPCSSIINPSGALLVTAATFLFSSSAVRFGVADHPSTGEPTDGGLLGDSLRGARQILASRRSCAA